MHTKRQNFLNYYFRTRIIFCGENLTQQKRVHFAIYNCAATLYILQGKKDSFLLCVVVSLVFQTVIYRTVQPFDVIVLIPQLL